MRSEPGFKKYRNASAGDDGQDDVEYFQDRGRARTGCQRSEETRWAVGSGAILRDPVRLLEV